MADRKILNSLETANVFSVEQRTDRVVVFTEECDGYFQIALNKDGIGGLIKELTEIHSEMIGTGHG